MTDQRKNKIKKAVQDEFKMKFFEVTEWAGDLVATSRENLNELDEEERDFLKSYTGELIDSFEYDIEEYFK